MQEIWKDISGFEGCYQVSNLGNVRSLDRYVESKGKPALHKGVLMKPQVNHKGYYSVILHKSSKPYTKLVHRLVATAFISNPNNLPQVNHKDTDKKNNYVSNLEWCTNQENQDHAKANGCYSVFTQKQYDAVRKNLLKVKREKAVIQMDAFGNKLKEYSSMREAEEETGVSNSKICACCKKRRGTAGGFKWKYKEEVA